MAKTNRYERIIEHIFAARHRRGGRGDVPFSRDDIAATAKKLGIRLPKNIGDLVYTFRYRSPLPSAILDTAPQGQVWVIRPAGPGRYRFSLTAFADIEPNAMLAETKIPDATPGLIAMYALGDEQALLAKVRYNRMLDVFTGVACYSLQSHLRTTAPDMGQVETDEVYVGVDKRGVHYVLPVQAKGHSDRLNVVQIEQDLAMCAGKFPQLVCRPIAAQFIEQDLIALFEFVEAGDSVAIACEKHYRLVPPEDIDPDDLKRYRQHSGGDHR